MHACLRAHKILEFKLGRHSKTELPQWKALDKGVVHVGLNYGFTPTVDGEFWEVCFRQDISGKGSADEVYLVELFRCISRPAADPKQLAALRGRFERPKAAREARPRREVRRGPYVPRKPGEPIEPNESDLVHA